MSAICPICQSISVQSVESHNDYVLYLCATCDVVFSDPMRAESSYYENSLDYQMRDTLIMDPIKWDFRWDMLEFLNNPPETRGSLLDIGCGTGYFVKRAQELGFSAHGIETTERSVKSGRSFFNLDTIHATDLKGYIDKFPGSKFDVITLFQVLEHVEDPMLLLREIKQVLVENGTLVIAVPLRDRWPDTSGEEGDYPPHHLTRWSPESLEYILRMNGFRIRKQLIENFPLRNMPTFIYSYILKLAPFLTYRGQTSVTSEEHSKAPAELPNLTEDQTLALLKRRRMKMRLATFVGTPLWLALKGLGAKGPNIYIEAVIKD